MSAFSVLASHVIGAQSRLSRWLVRHASRTGRDHRIFIKPPMCTRYLGLVPEQLLFRAYEASDDRSLKACLAPVRHITDRLALEIAYSRFEEDWREGVLGLDRPVRDDVSPSCAFESVDAAAARLTAVTITVLSRLALSEGRYDEAARLACADFTLARQYLACCKRTRTGPCFVDGAAILSIVGLGARALSVTEFEGRLPSVLRRRIIVLMEIFPLITQCADFERTALASKLKDLHMRLRSQTWWTPWQDFSEKSVLLMMSSALPQAGAADRSGAIDRWLSRSSAPLPWWNLSSEEAVCHGLVGRLYMKNASFLEKERECIRMLKAILDSFSSGESS